MEIFGIKPADEAKCKTFKWGTKDQLLSLERKDKLKPVKLKQVKTRKADSSLGGIQLIFEDGIETDVFDAGDPAKNSLVTYDVKDLRITKVSARANPCSSGTYINHIKFHYSDDTEGDVFPSTNTSGTMHTKDVPDGFEICGLYAYTEDPNSYKRMHAVQFILCSSGKK